MPPVRTQLIGSEPVAGRPPAGSDRRDATTIEPLAVRAQGAGDCAVTVYVPQSLGL
jgi:hypothetical protein